MNRTSQGPNVLNRLALVGAALALPLGATACGSDENSGTKIEYQVGEGSTDPATTTTAEGGTASTESLDNSYEGMLERLEASGMSRELAEEILALGEMPLHNPEACFGFIADAKGGETQAKREGWLISAGGELVVNTDMFATAGEGIVENDGPNLFTDSVADDFMEGDQTKATEVTDYFGDPTKVEERTREAVSELFANFCGDAYELASGQVSTANARIGNTNVRLGEIFKGALGQYVIDGEITQQSMTEMVQEALSNYVIEFPVGIDTEDERKEYLANHPEEAEKRINAYNKQLEDASKLISVLLNFLPVINQETTHVDISSQTFGTGSRNYPNLIFSSEPIDASGEPHGLGGEYDAMPASLLSFLGKFKAGCVSIEGGALVFNLLDGRSGYSNVLVSAPEGCEPIIITTTTTPGDTTPSKYDDGELPGDGTDASQDGGTPDNAGQGPAGQTPGSGGYVPGETTPGTQPQNSNTGSGNTAPASTGPAPSSTEAPAPATTSVNTSVPQSGTLPPPPGPSRIVHGNRVTASEEILNPVSNRMRMASSVIIRHI